jgi:ParB/RepB/Spo0J family partition protein
MDKQALISIDLIDHNPYQPRQSEDPAVVSEIAESIRQNGLMQVPVARQMNGRYQLAFGHTRLAAFKQLQEETMPLILRELDDLQLFELGVAENIKRRDLNPIELGESMRRYMHDFGKNSVETGEFFNVSPEAVRGAVRLLNLPETLQAGVADGTITQNNARRLLTLQRVAPKEVNKVSKELIKNKAADPDEVISKALKDSGNSVEMFQKWQRGEPLAGVALWPLRTPAEAFPSKHLADLTVSQAAKLLDINLKTYQDKLVWQDRINGLANGTKPEDFSESADSGAIERLAHLIKPPACTACPFYARIDGSHFCTFKACHSRKTKAWKEDQIQTASKTLKIAIYDSATDGKDTYPMISYRDEHVKLVKDTHADLRLKAGMTYANFEGVPEGFVIVAVGKTAENLHKADERKNGDRSSSENNESYLKEQRRLSQMRDANEAAVYEFLWNVATPALQCVMSGVTSLDFLNQFADRVVRGVPAEEPGRKATKAVKVDFYRRAILFSLLDDGLWDICQKKHPVAAIAKHLQGVATTWGVKLPKNWMEVAAEADKGIKLPVEEKVAA